VGLARLEKACDPTAEEGVFGCDVEAMDSSDNEVWQFSYSAKNTVSLI